MGESTGTLDPGTLAYINTCLHLHLLTSILETSFGESTGTLDPGTLAYIYTCLHLYLLTSILEPSFGESTGTLELFDPGNLLHELLNKEQFDTGNFASRTFDSGTANCDLGLAI